MISTCVLSQLPRPAKLNIDMTGYMVSVFHIYQTTKRGGCGGATTKNSRSLELLEKLGSLVDALADLQDVEADSFAQRAALANRHKVAILDSNEAWAHVGGYVAMTLLVSGTGVSTRIPFFAVCGVCVCVCVCVQGIPKTRDVVRWWVEKGRGPGLVSR